MGRGGQLFFSGDLRLPWPAWATLGWGIGLAFHYVDAYINAGNNPVEKEYEKLKQQQQS